jgi:tetratricopeptide (TPR) repeat protein
MMRRALACLLLLAASATWPAAAQSVQYRSPDGVEYRSQPDTGAVARAEAALAADPRNQQRILELGLAQAGVRQYREAIATFTRGLELAPDDATLLRWRGHRYLSVRELDLAEADLVRGLALDPFNYGILYHLGIVRFVQGDFDGAAALFERAQPVAPNAGELAGSTDWRWMSLARAGHTEQAALMLAARPDSLPVENAYAQRLRLYRGEVGPEGLLPADGGDDITVATLAFGLGNWHLVRADTAQARAAFTRAVAAADGWPAFGFIAAEAELRRLAARP